MDEPRAFIGLVITEAVICTDIGVFAGWFFTDLLGM